MNELEDKVWVCFPSVNPEKGKKAASRWREKGYRVGVYVQDSDFINSDTDPNHTAEEIGAQYLEKFPDGFGVMQPCGDRQGMDSTGKPAAARICGSPWFGKGWVEKAFGGEYVVPTEFFHFYGDEVLKEVAERLGVLWMRDDLIQDHQHWAFGRQDKEKYQEDNSRNHWQEDKNRFMDSQKKGFEDYLEKFKKPQDSY